MRQKHIARISVIILAGFALWVAFQPNPYLRNGLRYLTAGIYDYTIFPNARINTAKIKEWPIEGSQKKLTADQTKLLEHYQTVAFLIMQQDTLRVEHYFLNHTDTTISNSFSAAKSVISLLIGRAIEEGYIQSVNDPVGKYIPEYKADRYKDLAVEHLLTMSSGLDWNESYWNPFSVTTKAYYGNDLRSLVCPLPRKEAPGEKWEYLSANTQLLAIILRESTGKSVSELAETWLWKPLGAGHTAKWSLDKAGGMAKAYCCLNATARDFARIGNLVLNRGILNGDTLIAPHYMKRATSPNWQLKDPEGASVDFYGYQWWIAHIQGYRCVYARGILGQYIAVVPELELVVVRLGHKRSKEKVNQHPVDFLNYMELVLSISKTNI
ncbi:MAG: serine hydrolase [Bacteroidales bacterium]